MVPNESTHHTQGPRRYAASLLAPVLAAILATACGRDADSDADPFEGARWTVDGPEIRIGSVDDPMYAFGPVVDLLPGPDGSLYSLHQREGSIRRWSPDGTPSGLVGRGGEGPGEFQRPWDMGFFGDSLWVWDLDGFHVSYFDLQGEFLGRVSPRVDIGGPEGSPPRPSRPFRDGTFLGREPAWSHEIATGELTETAFAHMGAEGGSLGTIWMQPHEPRDGLALLREDGGGTFGPQAFGDGVAYRIDDDGLVVVERRAWTGEGEAVFTLTRIGLAGDTAFSVRVPYTPVPMAAERIDSAVVAVTESMYEFMSARQPGLARGALEQRIRDATYKPAHVPPVGGIMLDDDGNIWVRRFDPVELDPGELDTGELDPGEAFNEWWIMDPHGIPLARTLTPMGLRVRHIGNDVVWGTERDDLDVDYIVRYRLVKGS